jgi:hypothetical protein
MDKWRGHHKEKHIQRKKQRWKKFFGMRDEDEVYERLETENKLHQTQDNKDPHIPDAKVQLKHDDDKHTQESVENKQPNINFDHEYNEFIELDIVKEQTSSYRCCLS